MENIELLKKLPAFSSEYRKAKARTGDTVWSKALLISPLFSYVKKLPEFEGESDTHNALQQSEIIKRQYDLKDVNFSRNATTVVLGNDDQYKSSVFYGYQLNTVLHFQILNYMVEILFNQFDSGFPSSTVTIDLNIMIEDLELDQKSKSFYRKTVEDLIIRLAHSSSRIEFKDGTVVNDRYVYKYSHDENKNVFETVFGDIFIDSIISDEWRQKHNYRDLQEIKEGAARFLFIYINAMYRPITIKGKVLKMSRISIDTILTGRDFKVNGNKSKKKNAKEIINDAIKYLTDEVGFITHTEDVKRGIKEVWLNPDFNLRKFADAKRLLKKPVDAKSLLIDKTPVVSGEAPMPFTVDVIQPAELLPTEQALSNIMLNFGKIGVNPDFVKDAAEKEARSSEWDVWENSQFEIPPVSEPIKAERVNHDDDFDDEASLREFDELMSDLDKAKSNGPDEFDL